MKPEELAQLNPGQKRERIAEACGALWHKTHDYRQEYAWTAEENAIAESYHPKELLCFHYPEGKKPILPICHRQDGRALGGDIPDYLNDLNAMNEAEKVLTDTQFGSYHYHLCHQVERTPGQRPFSTCATAAQRADAFLLTVDVGKNKIAEP